MNYYQLLGLKREATPDQIKKSYRRLAMKWHPDRNAGNAEAAEKFKDIKEAYECLSDPGRRKHYDEHGVDQTVDCSSAEIAKLIIAAFRQAISGDRGHGILARATKALSNKVNEIRMQQARYRKDAEGLAALKDGITTKEGVENLFLGVVEDAIRERDEAIAEMDGAIASLKEAVDNLKSSYSEKPAPVAANDPKATRSTMTMTADDIIEAMQRANQGRRSRFSDSPFSNTPFRFDPRG